LQAAIEGRAPVKQPVAERPAAPPVTAIDPDRVQGFEATLGREARDLLLALLIDNTLRVPARIREMADAGRLDQVRLEAHGLRGAAASVGAYRLIDILMQIELGAADQLVSEALLSRLDAAANEVASSARLVLLTSNEAKELSLSSSN
jgi:HPt (histidine-containing phosphotransfer) domain-containing protein